MQVQSLGQDAPASLLNCLKTGNLLMVVFSSFGVSMSVLVSQSCLFATPWTIAHEAPLSVGILQARILEWIAIPISRGSSQPRD